jgi:hypothetical protein
MQDSRVINKMKYRLNILLLNPWIRLLVYLILVLSIRMIFVINIIPTVSAAEVMSAEERDESFKKIYELSMERATARERYKILEQDTYSREIEIQAREHDRLLKEAQTKVMEEILGIYISNTSDITVSETPEQTAAYIRDIENYSWHVRNTYLASMKKISNIIDDNATFITYEKSIRDILSAAKNGLPHLINWNYANDSVIRTQFELLLNNNDNDYLIRQLYLEYLTAHQLHLSGNAKLDDQVYVGLLLDISSRFPNETDIKYAELIENYENNSIDNGENTENNDNNSSSGSKEDNDFNESKITLLEIINESYFNNLEEPIQNMILTDYLEL